MEFEELTVDYFEGDLQTCKELDKVVLTKGAWSTIMFKYQDWDSKKQEYGPVKFTIRRYQKYAGSYKQKSKFNISSSQQARKIIEALESWTENPKDD